MRMRRNRVGLRRRQRGETPSTAIVYRGPVTVTGGPANQRTLTTNITVTGVVASSASGIISSVYNTTYFTGATEWTSYWTNLYQEYRVLALKLTYEPYYTPGFPTSALPSVGAGAAVHNALLAAPTTLAAVLENSTHKLFHPGRKHVQTWKMGSVEESEFTDVNSSSNKGGAYIFCDGLSNSTTYGKFFVTTTVQLRGRA